MAIPMQGTSAQDFPHQADRAERRGQERQGIRPIRKWHRPSGSKIGRSPLSAGCVGRHQLLREPRHLQRPFGVVAGVGLEGDEVLAAVEGELAVAAQLYGSAGELLQVIVEGRRQTAGAPRSGRRRRRGPAAAGHRGRAGGPSRPAPRSLALRGRRRPSSRPRTGRPARAGRRWDTLRGRTGDTLDLTGGVR